MSAQTITLLAALLAFAASIIATAVAAYNGRFGKFARERWWERQAEVYTWIIEALAGMVYYHEEHLTAYEEGRSIPEGLSSRTSYFISAATTGRRPRPCAKPKPRPSRLSSALRSASVRA
jgi:hypothetical protein